MAFAGHFHRHSEFSPLDGTGNANQYSKEAVKKNQTHLGHTDHGRLGGVLDTIDVCRHPEKYDDPDDESHKRGKDETLIPVVGLEAFWRPDRFMDLTDKDLYGKNGHNWAQHLCLHAGSLRGWRTLLRLSSKSWVKRENGGGFYGKACIDPAMLEEDHEDIVISTACMSSPLAQFILKGDEDGARDWLEWAVNTVGPNNVWLEIMPHDLEEQRVINIEKINLANEFGLPFMVTGDVHMPYKDWAKVHSVVRMASYQQTISQQAKKEDAGEDTYTEEIDTAYLSSEEELMEMFLEHHPDIPQDLVQEGLNNTVEFARNIRWYNIGKATKLPKVTRNEREAVKIIRKWCDEGFRRITKKWKNAGANDAKIAELLETYHERFEYEFGVLQKKGVLDYFVMVGDMVRWAKSDAPLPGDTQKKRPIRVGLGRGSAAGCLISYLIGITAIDPISWKLLFERFLNPDRIGLPDIDLDFETDIPILEVNGVWMDGRELVKEYLRRKYGHDHVADIIAYQTFAPRAVIKAVGDTQDIPYKQIKDVTDSIGDTERNLVEIAAKNPIVAAFAEKNPFVWDCCLKLEDQILRDTKHAGGVVITDKPTTTYMPTQLGNDEKSIVTAWADRANFPIVSDYGFVKMDILGVRGLSKQQLTVDLIREHYEVEFEPNELPALSDPYDTQQEVIDAFVHGLTLGVFQFGGEGITKLLRHIKPDNAIDIAVANALYRPGPIKIAFEYGDRKNGKIPDSEWYWHDSLEPVLGETLGLIAFQEQVMEITKTLGGFTGGQADSMRKAISKLYRLPGDEARAFMQGFKDQWMDGCRSNGISAQAAELIWERILEFAGYGFNKSHSASYALQAYQDMHLKVNFPLAFYAALLTIEKKAKAAEQNKFLKGVLREARVLGVEALPPDVNRSERGWTIDGRKPIRKTSDAKIRFGLVSIKDVGGNAVDMIREERENRLFTSFDNFMGRMPSNFSVGNTVALAKAGAFDNIADRVELLTRVREWPETTAKLKVEMTCGCKKTKTVKNVDTARREAYETLEEAIEVALDEIVCKKHESATVREWEEADPYYTYVEFAKDKPGKDPGEGIPPTEYDISEMEQEVLNVPLSIGDIMVRYAPFINDRIYTEQEIEDLPAKPRRKGKAHGTFCSCKECEAAHCVVGGEITSVKVIETKAKKEKMAFVEVVFGVNNYSCTFFPGAYREFSHLFDAPTGFLIAGHRDDRGQIIVYAIDDVRRAAAESDWIPPEPKKVDPPAKVLQFKKPVKNAGKKLKFKREVA